jgi:hypothetical protein
MKTTTTHKQYRPTESKRKGGAKEMYVTYDLEQRTRGGGSAVYPKVKRVYIAGDVKSWDVGEFPKRSGREVYGVRIEYEQGRRRYRRGAYPATRGGTEYEVPLTKVGAATQRFAQVVELPREARDVRFHAAAAGLSERDRHALQDVR